MFLASLQIKPRNRQVSISRRDSRYLDGQSLASLNTPAVGRISRELLDNRLVEVSRGSDGQVALVERVRPASRWHSIMENKQRQEMGRQQFQGTWLLTYSELEAESYGDFVAMPDKNQNWTPAGGYGEGHQAAIETALSTVLTVSTLAGFRAHQANANHCCLHHAVQLTKVSFFFLVDKFQIKKHLHTSSLMNSSIHKREVET